jgi:hypothetical protein
MPALPVCFGETTMTLIVRLNLISGGIGCGAALMAAMLWSSAHGAVVATAYQDGANVVVTGAGSLNLGGLTDGAVDGPLQPTLRADRVYLMVGGSDAFPLTRQYYGLTAGIAGPSAIGSGTSILVPDYTVGNLFGINGNSGGQQSVMTLAVPLGFQNNGYVSGTSIFSNTTLALMGLGVGSYTWQWGAGGFGSGDSFTLNVATVPEPHAFEAAVATLACIGGLVVLSRKARDSGHALACVISVPLTVGE